MKIWWWCNGSNLKILGLVLSCLSLIIIIYYYGTLCKTRSRTWSFHGGCLPFLWCTFSFRVDLGDCWMVIVTFVPTLRSPSSRNGMKRLQRGLLSSSWNEDWPPPSYLRWIPRHSRLTGKDWLALQLSPNTCLQYWNWPNSRRKRASSFQKQNPESNEGFPAPLFCKSKSYSPLVEVCLNLVLQKTLNVAHLFMWCLHHRRAIHLQWRATLFD